MNYRLSIAKRRLEDIFILPFVMFGRMRARRTPLKQSYDAFLFFPTYTTGGAEKIHARIAMALHDKKCLIIFTRYSQNDGTRWMFQASGHDIIDISAYTDNKLRYWNNLIWRGVAAEHINSSSKKVVVFNGQCNFAYKCSRWISAGVPQYELIHSFNSLSLIRIPFIQFYRRTVMSSHKAVNDHQRQYAEKGMPGVFSDRIIYIRYGIQLPENVQARNTSGRVISCLFAGRGAAEKRVYLFARIARRCMDAGLNARFTMMGDVHAALKGELTDHLVLKGNVTDPAEIEKVYQDADILILTSSDFRGNVRVEEGFPLVVMEAMANGCIILATGVGEIPEHVHADRSGYLFSTVADEEKIVSEAFEHVRRLIESPELCHQISEHNIRYAAEHFGMPNFNRAYRNLLYPEKETY